MANDSWECDHSITNTAIHSWSVVCDAMQPLVFHELPFFSMHTRFSGLSSTISAAPRSARETAALWFFASSWSNWNFWNYDRKRNGWSKSFFCSFLLVSVKNGTWSCRSNEPVLMSGNSHLASAWWSYLKMLWMLRLCISSRTDWISSGNDVGNKSLA